MATLEYSAYLIRVWRRQSDDAIVRVLVEEVVSGRRVELHDRPAAVLACAVAASLDADDQGCGRSWPPTGHREERRRNIDR